MSICISQVATARQHAEMRGSQSNQQPVHVVVLTPVLVISYQILLIFSTHAGITPNGSYDNLNGRELLPDAG